MQRITDIWFQTELSLQKLANRLGVVGAEFDYENVFEWVIGTFSDSQIDIARNHTDSASDTTIFMLGSSPGKPELPTALQEELIESLKSLGIAPLFLGTRMIGKDDEPITNVVRRID